MESDVCLEDCYPEPLLAIASYGLAASSRVLPTQPLSEEAWLAVLGSARSNRLTGLLCAAVEDGSLPTTCEQLNQARQLQMSMMIWAMRLEAELLAIVDLLTASALDVRVLKGSAVAHLDYPDPALRSFIDLDVLVRSEQIDRAIELFISAGFQRRHPQPRPGFDRRFSKGTTFLSPTGYELDLHRTFAQGPWGLSMDVDDLWDDDGEEFKVAGRSLRALSRPARFMHACYHAALGDWPPRLLSLRDIAQMLLVTGQNESDLRAIAARWRAEAVLAVAVSDTWHLLGIDATTRISDWAQATCRRNRMRRAWPYTDTEAGPPQRRLCPRSRPSLDCGTRPPSFMPWCYQRPSTATADTPRPSRDSDTGWPKHDADAGTAMNRIDLNIGPRCLCCWDWCWSPATSSSRLLSWRDYPMTFAAFFLVVPLLAVLSVPMLAKARRAEPDPWIGRLFTFALLAMMSMGVVHIFLSAYFVPRGLMRPCTTRRAQPSVPSSGRVILSHTWIVR